MRFEGSGAEALDGGEDVVGGLGPAEGFGSGVVGVDVGVDGRLELGGRAMAATAQRTLGEAAEKAFDLIEPRRAGRRKMHGPTRSPGEPVADQLGLVAAGVVEHDVDREVGRHAGVDGIEEAAELLRPVAWEAAPDHVAGGDIERGEQRGRTVALIVVRPPLGLAGPQRQERLGAVERLDLGLLVHAQHDRAIRWLKIEPDDVAHLRRTTDRPRA